jgi:hypothetical protein
MKKEDFLFSLILGATLVGFIFVLGHKPKPTVEAGKAAPGISKPALKNPASAPVTAPKPLSLALPDASAIQLAALGTQVLEKIPSKDQMRGLTDEDVHQIAKPIFEASLQLKLYGDQLEVAMNAAAKTGNVAEVAAQGADFYEKCATRDDAPESLRAVCFIEFAKFSTKSGHPEKIAQLHMPEVVLQIALEIAPSA